MKQRVLVALLACMGATSAWAADSGVYLGVGAGQFNVETEADLGGLDSNDTVFKVFGGYRFSPMFSVELDYIDLGAPEDRGVEAQISGFAPYATLTLPIGPVEIFGRVGMYFYDVEVSGVGISDNDSSEDLVYGLGAGLTLFEHLHARLEYEFFDIENTDTANALWLSAAWRF